jgi:hypothetical protein
MRDVTLMSEWLAPLLPERGMRSHFNSWGLSRVAARKNRDATCPTVVIALKCRCRDNMARLPKDFLATDFRGSPRKICKKSCGATLSGRTIFLNIEARFRVRGLFLPHIMAAGTWQPYQDKKGKKATPRYVAGPFAPLCCVDSDFGGIRAILSGGNPPRYGSCPLLVI